MLGAGSGAVKAQPAAPDIGPCSHTLIVYHSAACRAGRPVGACSRWGAPAPAGAEAPDPAV